MPKYISSPRPLFDDDSVVKGKKKKKRLSMGSTTAGVVMDVTKEGIHFNGYYMGMNRPVKYASMIRPGFISWEDLDKVRESLSRTRKKKGQPDFTDEPTEEYLETLAKVTLNGRQFYIDPDRKERRSVDQPWAVFKF